MGLHKQEWLKLTYANIYSDGTIRVNSDESNPNAVKRDYEVETGEKDASGKAIKITKTKFEEIFKELSGVITGIKVAETPFGSQLEVSVADDNGEIIMCSGIKSSFTDDILRKLPNIDLEKEVIFSPWSMEKNGKTRKGMSVVQDGKKIQNFFYNYETQQSLPGFPEIKKKINKKTGEEKEITSEEWTIHFALARQFMLDYMEENILPKLGQKRKVTIDDIPDEPAYVPEGEIETESVPFN